MTGTNQFYAFANGGGANVLTPSAYAALTTLLANGFSAGIAQSQQLNTVWRQSTAIANLIGSFIAAQGYNAYDDGNASELLTAFENAMAAYITAVAPEPDLLGYLSKAGNLSGIASASAARSNIGAAASGSNTDITSLSSPALGNATCNAPSGSDSSSRVMNTYYYVNQGSGDVGTDAQCWGGNGTAFSNNSTYSGSTIQGVGSFNFNFGTWKALSTVQIGGWGGSNFLTTFRRVA